MRKFSERLDNEIDAAYIRQCFADLIDSGVANVEEREDFYKVKFVSISISQFEIDRIISPATEFISRNNSLKRYIDTQNKNNDRLQDIKLSLERLADEYPNYKISVEHFTSIFIKIFAS
jgi:isocitrate dehydrogenase kinase/phosphatase